MLNWKYGSFKHLFFIAQWYTCMGNLQVEVHVLQSLICWLILLLKPKVYKEVPLGSDKKVYKQLLLLVEKYKSNLISKEIKYLTDFKWQKFQYILHA